MAAPRPLRLEALEARRLLSSAPGPLSVDGLTPAQISHAYHFDGLTFPSRHGLIPAIGSGETIAIVGAFRAPRIAADLRTFDRAFGLPNRTARGGFVLRIATPQGQPSTNASWAQELSLDVEWAHATAPGAQILLVEAISDSPQDLAKAVDSARRRRGVAVVSMSFGYDTPPVNAAEFNALFTTPLHHVAGLSAGDGVTFVQAGGEDGATTSWPDASVPVVSVGATTLAVDAVGNYLGETAFARNGPSNTVAYAAESATGFAIYDSTPFQGIRGWNTVQGTSVATPQWAALIAIADQGRTGLLKHTLDGVTQTLPALASFPASDFHVIPNGGLGTGRGSPYADRVIADLVAI
jgi:subtilase family serine protease